MSLHRSRRSHRIQYWAIERLDFKEMTVNRGESVRTAGLCEKYLTNLQVVAKDEQRNFRNEKGRKFEEAVESHIGLE